MRPSGRAPDQMRELSFEPGFTKHAEGSCLVAFGDTRVLVTASVEVRARRRVAELLSRGMPAHLEDVIIDLKARDARDSERDTAPLVQAGDALLLDTSGMTIDEAVAAAISLVEEKVA